MDGFDEKLRRDALMYIAKRRLKEFNMNHEEAAALAALEARELHDLLEVHPALAAAARLLAKKSQDYNGSVDVDPARESYFPFGHQSYLHMLHTKFERIKQVALSKDKPNFESLEDSLIDLINYSAFYWSWVRKHNGDS